MDLTETGISSETLTEGILLKAYRDRVRLPDGTESIREWIDHPGASAIVPIFDDGSTILVRQFRYPPRREFLEVPAGKLDVAGEPPDEVALRELEEETGWQCGRVESLASLYPCIGYSNEIIHFFVGWDLTPGKRSLEDGEQLEPIRMPFDKALRMATSGEILDIKTVAALVLASTRVGP